MSFMVDLHVQPAIVAGALALDNLLACINHKLPKDAKKHKLLAEQTKVYSARLNDVANNQGLMDTNSFMRAAYEHYGRIKGERVEIAQRAAAQKLAREMGMQFV